MSFLFGPPNVEELKAKRDVRGLIKALKYEKDRQVCRTAAKALGEIGDRKAVEPLITVLKDRDWHVQQSAVEALGKLGDERAVRPLIAALEETNQDIRQKAADALVKIGKPAVEPLIETLNDNRPDRSVTVQRYVIEVLGKLGDERAVQPLIVALKDSNREVREELTKALVKIGKSAVKPLIVTLQDNRSDRSVTVQGYAIEVLGKLGDERAVEPLIAALNDSNRDVRQKAVKALGDLKYRPAMDDINGLLSDPDYQIRAEAAQTLRRFAENARSIARLGMPHPSKVFADNPQPDSPEGIRDKRSVNALIAALQDQVYYVRAQAAYALGWFRDRGAVEPLMHACHDENLGVRKAAVIALGFLEDGEATPLLIEIANDQTGHLQLREQAMCALGHIPDPRAIPLLNRLMQDKNKDLSTAASEALLSMGEESAAGWSHILSAAAESFLPRLAIDMALRKSRHALEYSIIALSDNDPKVQAWAAYILGKLRHSRATPVLLEALQNASDEVQGMAAFALGEIKDSRAVTPLIEYLESPTWQVRVAAAWALAALGDKRAVEPLARSIIDPEQMVRRAAALALGRIDPQRLQEELQKLAFEEARHALKEARLEPANENRILEDFTENVIEMLFEYIME